MISVDSDLADELSHHDKYFTARELVEGYADELEYDRDQFDTSLDDRPTDARTWQPGDRLYRIDGNVSIYPAEWHDRLADTTDLAEYAEVMLESVRAPEGVEVRRGDLGVAQDDLYAFQNPEELVRLPRDDSE